MLHTVLSSCSVPILQSMALVDQIIKTFLEADVRLPFNFQCCGDDIFNFYPLLRDFNFHFQNIEDVIQAKFQGDFQLNLLLLPALPLSFLIERYCRPSTFFCQSKRGTFARTGRVSWSFPRNLRVAGSRAAELPQGLHHYIHSLLTDCVN